MSFELYEMQNWKISKKLYMELESKKNMDMINFRLARNLSQQQAAEQADIAVSVWRDLENKKLVPTETQATKVALLLGKNAYKLFPIRRHNTLRLLPLKSMSKLAVVRCLQNISQIELAKQSGIPLRVIQKIEREWKEITDVPKKDLGYIQVIADILGQDVVDIIGTVIE